MPTLFSRKYMRGKPKVTERVVGVVILGLLAFIVGTFLLTGGLLVGLVNRSPKLTSAKAFFGISERPLFVAAPENLKPAPPPHEQRVAEAMLPALPELWKRSAVSVSPDSKAKLPSGFDAAHLYTAQYQQSGAGPEYAVSVADMTDPQAASGAWQALTPPGARQASIGRGAWLDSAGRSAAFWAGRYLTQVTAQDSQNGDQLEALLRALAAVQLDYGGPFVAASAPAENRPAAAAQPAGQVRFAEVKGTTLQPPMKVERFTDNLYEKIDGREGEFRGFGFVELRFGTYQDTRSRQSYDVYVYDMGQPNNALGIYTAEKSDAAGSLGVGQEGYMSGTSAYFYKGKYYVNILGPADGDDADVQNSQRIAGAIAETIADAGAAPWADTMLPKEGRVGSLRYQTTSALAHDFLERFFFASYKIDGVDFDMFIHREPGAAEAKALFAKYAEETPKYENVVSRETAGGVEMLVSETTGVYTAAFHKGPYFAGVTECKSRELAVKRAATLRDKLNANDKGEPPGPKPAAPKEESSEASHESSEGGGEHGN